jgi:hypothetical protein
MIGVYALSHVSALLFSNRGNLWLITNQAVAFKQPNRSQIQNNRKPDWWSWGLDAWWMKWCRRAVVGSRASCRRAAGRTGKQPRSADTNCGTGR